MAQGQQLGVDSQANAQTPSDMNDQLPEPAAESVDLQDTRTVPGEIIGAGTFDEPLRPTNPYSAEQYQHALELRQRRLSGTHHRNFAYDNGAVPHSETRIPDYRYSRVRAPDGTTSSTPAEPAPEGPDGAFYWYSAMTEMQRQNGIWSFQNEFSKSNKFARSYVS
jgi:hypothetical protein